MLQLATEQRESGVDVILDKWDLKEGHDANAFMEKMVSDPSIKKVVLICDKIYAEKTDGRRGGVGTEAQIISGEIYAKETQEKFVAVVRERDLEGKAYLPTYYKSRVYIDLSDPVTTHRILKDYFAGFTTDHCTRSRRLVPPRLSLMIDAEVCRSALHLASDARLMQ